MASATFDDLTRWLSQRLEDGALCILIPSDGDLDAVSSAVTLARLLGPRARACATHLSAPSRNIAEKYGLDIQVLDPMKPVWPRSLSGLVVVDCGSLPRVGMNLPAVPVCVIDHHASNSWEREQVSLLFLGNRSSTCEIIFEWYKNTGGREIDSLDAKLLLSGLVADTGRFRFGDAQSLQTAFELATLIDQPLPEFIEGLSPPIPREMAIGTLTALSRSRIDQSGKWLVGYARGGSHEGRACHVMLTAGVDVAIVTRNTSDGVRVIGRASHDSIGEGMNLGALFLALSASHKGDGGGHAGAAGWTSELDVTEAESAVLAAIASWPVG